MSKNNEEMVATSATIAPAEDVEMEVSEMVSDEEMEEPRSKDYYEEQAETPNPEPNSTPDVKVVFKPEFKEALLKTIGTLGYDRVLGSPEINIRVNQIFDAYNALDGRDLTEEQANNFISMIAKAPYSVIGEVMTDIKTDVNKYFDVKIG